MPEIGPVAGLPVEGTIISYDPARGEMSVNVNLAVRETAAPLVVKTPPITSWFAAGGELSGGFPVIGATVSIMMGQGGQWHCLGYRKPSALFETASVLSQGTQDDTKLDEFTPGAYFTQVSNDVRTHWDPLQGIRTGSPESQTHVDPAKNIYSSVFSQNYTFNNALRRIEGVVKRDLQSNSTRNVSGSALTSHIYEEGLTPIGLDPLTRAGDAFFRNPPFVESREEVYEFAYDFGFTTDATENDTYRTKIPTPLTIPFPRRESRADTLSLDLTAPNYLMETVKGTIVDLYGNLLDINRSILPAGRPPYDLRAAEGNEDETFRLLRELERKTISYHWEINSRKKLPIRDINSDVDYGRDRSRFGFDVDKEGQFRFNVPMSSEVGNVPLLLRYSNYSTLLGAEEDADPNAFVRNVDHQDIFVESFGEGGVALTGARQGGTPGFAAPVDRITGEPAKLATAFHDVLNTAFLMQQPPPVLPWYPDSSFNDTDLVPTMGLPATDSVTVSGDDANAGGRSGTISLDGFLAASIGANSVDRQSLWFDTAGGVVANIGRDTEGRSYTATYDGDVRIQIGSFGVATDSRFQTTNDLKLQDGIFDMRVQVNGTMHCIRIDAAGVSIATPSSVDIVAEDLLRLKGAQIILEAENIWMYGSDLPTARLVERRPGVPI